MIQEFIVTNFTREIKDIYKNTQTETFLYIRFDISICFYLTFIYFREI